MFPYEVCLPQSVPMFWKFACVYAVVTRAPAGKSLNVTRNTANLTVPVSCARADAAASQTVTTMAITSQHRPFMDCNIVALPDQFKLVDFLTPEARMPSSCPQSHLPRSGRDPDLRHQNLALLNCLCTRPIFVRVRRIAP